MLHHLPVAVDHGLLEPERFGQEPDQCAGVAGAQRWPDLRLRCRAHGLSSSCGWPGWPWVAWSACLRFPRPAAAAWTFRNSSAIHWLGGQPASDLNSRARCAWSKYPHAAARPARPVPAAALRRFRAAAAGPAEADDPRGSLRRQADLGAEPGGQITAAPAGLRGQVRDAHGPARGQQLPPGPADLRCGLRRDRRRDGRRGHQPQQHLVHDGEPLGPAGRGHGPGPQLGAHAAQHVLARARRSRPARPRAGPAGPGRPAAGARPEYRTGAPSCVISAGAECRPPSSAPKSPGGWRGIGVSQQDQRLVQREDQGQERRRQAPVPGGRHPPLAVACVPGHVRAQRPGRPRRQCSSTAAAGRPGRRLRISGPPVNLPRPSYVLLSRIPVSAQTSGF